MYDQVMNDEAVEKITRRYAGLSSKETATRLRDRYTRRREAIQRFTDRLKLDGVADQNDILGLRALGVTEDEISHLVATYSPY
ncbi:MAG: hypothetical protein IT463_13435 [Planctomycetes bacterium]|nr:hypothetical protein [Planctomycetota bacterium]